jgi:hypothetical protein
MIDSFDLAKLVYAAGNLDFPRDIYDRIMSTCSVNDDPLNYEVYSNALLASVVFLLEDEQFIEAKRVTEQSLQLRETFCEDKNDFRLAECKIMLCRCMQLVPDCNHLECKNLLQEALASAHYHFGHVHAQVADICYALALAHRNLHQYELSLHYHHIALHILKMTFGDKNPVTITAAGSVGLTIDHQSQFQVIYFTLLYM